MTTNDYCTLCHRSGDQHVAGCGYKPYRELLNTMWRVGLL